MHLPFLAEVIHGHFLIHLRLTALSKPKITITPAKRIKVIRLLPLFGSRQITAPNGGENWIAGTSRSITWSSGSFLSNYVKIEYSVDSGANWITVVASVTNNGSYSWTTPNTPSTLCLLKISETTNSANYDVSDATFTISPFITVTYPNGNENLLGCEIKNITYEQQGQLHSII